MSQRWHYVSHEPRSNSESSESTHETLAACQFGIPYKSPNARRIHRTHKQSSDCPKEIRHHCFKRLFKPTTRRLHVLNPVIKVVEVIAQENSRHAWVIRSGFFNQLQFVMNVWDDEARLIHALGLTVMSCIS